MSLHGRLSLLLTALTLAFLGHVCANGFIDLDDGVYVTANPHVLTGLTRENIRWAFTTSHANFWHPITWLSLQLDATIFGPDAAWGFHLTNLLLHLANVLLLYRVLAFMTRQDGLSFWVAALFAIHPLHVESVAWVTERKDVLSTFFWLLAMASYAKYACKPHWKSMALTALFLALGLMTKPMLVTLPFALLLLDYWPLRRWPQGNPISAFAPASPGRLIVEKTPLFLLVLFAAVIAFTIKRDLGEVGELPLSDRLANAIISYGWYLWKTFVPFHLGVYYPHPLGEWSAIALGSSILILGAISLWAFRAGRSRPFLLVGWLWFLGTLIPVIGLVQVGEQARGDRFVYVPHIGLFLALVWLFSSLIERAQWSRFQACGMASVVVLFLAVLTWFQVRHWQDHLSLWEHTNAATTGNHRAKAHLGAWLTQQKSPRDVERAYKLLEESLRLRDSATGRFWMGVTLTRLNRPTEAISHYRKAVELQTNYPLAHHNLGVLLANQGQIDEAMGHFRSALKGNSQAADSHLNLGVALVQQGAFEEAMSHFRQAQENRPGFGRAETQLGVVLLKQGRMALAEEHFRRALETAEADPTAEYYLGLIRARQQEWPKAVVSFTRVAPYHPKFRCALAYALHESGSKEAAREEYGKVLRQHPEWPSEFATSAYRIATHSNSNLRDAQEAFEMAIQACQATEFRKPELLDTLAVTQAAKGDFATAIKTSKEAMNLAEGKPELRQQIQDRLRLYETKQVVPASKK